MESKMDCSLLIETNHLHHHHHHHNHSSSFKFNNKDKNDSNSRVTSNMLDTSYLNDYASLYFEVGDLCLPFSNANNNSDLINANCNVTNMNFPRSSSVPINCSFLSNEEEEEDLSTTTTTTNSNTNNEDISAINAIAMDTNTGGSNIHLDTNEAKPLALALETGASFKRKAATSNRKRSKTMNSTLETESTLFRSNNNNNNNTINSLYANQLLSIDFKPIVDNYCCMVYTCLNRACGIETSTKYEILNHLNQIHNIQLSEECDEAQFNQHARLSYKCLFSHQQSQAPCGKKLENFHKIANHIRKDHSLFHNNKNLSYFFMCSHEDCLWLFESENALKIHKHKHKSDLIYEATATTSNVKKRKHTCPHCSSHFIRPSHLRAHLKLHESSEQRLKCDYCEEQFISQSLLLVHFNQKHKNAEKLHKCPFESCDKSYSLRMYLSSHITKTHTNRAVKSCEKKQQPESDSSAPAEQRFSFAWLKKEHDTNKIQHNAVETRLSLAGTPEEMRLADEAHIPQFRCDREGCGKLFRSKNNLRRHAKVHDKTKSKKHKCTFEDCMAEFGRREHLLSHMNAHNEAASFACSFSDCKSTFRYASNLQTHLKTIHGERGGGGGGGQTASILRYLSNETTTATRKEYLIVSLNEANKQQQQLNRSLSSDTSLNKTRIKKVIIKQNSGGGGFGKMVSAGLPLSVINNEMIMPQQQQRNSDVNKINVKLNDFLSSASPTEMANMKPSVLGNDSVALMSNIQLESGSENAASNFAAAAAVKAGANSVLLTNQTGLSGHALYVQGIMNSRAKQTEESVTAATSKENEMLVYYDDKFEMSRCGTQIRHVININSDDEECTTSSVVLDNLSGSARTDYKFNHIYIEKYTLKRKQRGNAPINSNGKSGSGRKRTKTNSNSNEEHFESDSKLTESPSSEVSTIASPKSIPSSLTLSPIFASSN